MFYLTTLQPLLQSGHVFALTRILIQRAHVDLPTVSRRICKLQYFQTGLLCHQSQSMTQMEHTTFMLQVASAACLTRAALQQRLSATPHHKTGAARSLSETSMHSNIWVRLNEVLRTPAMGKPMHTCWYFGCRVHREGEPSARVDKEARHTGTSWRHHSEHSQHGSSADDQNPHRRAYDIDHHTQQDQQQPAGESLQAVFMLIVCVNDTQSSTSHTADGHSCLAAKSSMQDGGRFVM